MPLRRASFLPILLSTFFLVGALTLIGCDAAGPGGDDDSKTAAGRVDVKLTATTGGGATAGLQEASAPRANVPDASAPASDDIVQAFVTISGVELVGEDDRYTLSDEEQTFNLLALEDGAPVDLALADVPAGEYEQLRLDVTDTHLVLSGGAAPNLKVPSGQVKLLLPDFEIEEDGESDEVAITVAFDVGDSFVKAGKSGKYVFKPAVRAQSVERSGEDLGGGVEIAGDVTSYTEGERIAIEGRPFAITAGTELEEGEDVEAGQPVELEGARAESGDDAYVAQEVETRDGDDDERAMLEAPIDEVRADQNTLVLLGAPFEVDGDTQLEGFQALSNLDAGSRAEVTFERNADGSYRAFGVESGSSEESDDDDGDDDDDDE